ncbi:MAG TPA: cytochrome c, partial [Gammaproteobacteria bacterium]|nr:cytochrome c [Gammaproteobacteria bacterium]
MIIRRGGRLAITAAATLLTILGAAGCQKSEPPAPPPAPAAQQPAAPAAAAVAKIPDGADQLTHGRYLVETIAGCGNCHTPHLPDGSLDESKAFSGAFVIEDPGFKAYARNITPDMETGIGSWTDDQIVNAIRNAQRPDGTFLGPPMSFAWYKRMSDTDVRAIV